MAHFEGDTTELSSKQLEYIASVLKKEGFHDGKVTIKTVGETGDNYVANVVRIIAEKDGKTFRMVAKVAPTLENLRMAMNTHILFNNEYVLYTQVLPKFATLEEAANIPVSERLRFAKFYGAIIEEPIELLLLEDLQVPGFVILDRFKPLPNDAIKLILKNFARLHSRSYALKNQEPDTYNELKDSLSDVWLLMAQEESNKLFIEKIEEDAEYVLDSEKHISIIKKYSGQRADILESMNETDFRTHYSVIQQGDSWTNNIMFRLEGTTPVECCMIDYQLAKVSSPAADLHYMIFNCTNYESRAKHFHEWIDYYYSELEKNLLELGLKSDYWYPREQLDADLKRHAPLGFSNALLLASILTRETAEAAQIKEALKTIGHEDNFKEMLITSSIASASEKTTAAFKTRIAETIDSLLELGYL